jgi:hypothetical protein
MSNGIQISMTIRELHDEGDMFFYDQFKRVDKHQGGVTIRSSEGDYYEPLQTSLAELTKSYAKQGRESPSKEAYKSLQKELSHYLTCYGVELVARAYKCNILLAEEVSCLFEFSYEYYDSLAEIQAYMEKEEGDWLKEKVMEEAQNKLKQLCA